MGFFSWRSCVSEHDIMNAHIDDGLYDGMAIILPDNTIISGDYDGYGRITTSEGQEHDIYDLIAKEIFGKSDRDLIFSTKGMFTKANKMIKVMHRSEVKEGMQYEKLPVSKNAEGQGFWYSSYEIRIKNN